MQNGKSESLVLTRQATLFKPAPPPPITCAPATAPVDVANLKAVLDEDFAKAEKEGIFAAKSGIGVAIGVVKSEKRTVLSLGSVKADSIFEIGSITKTFTGLILAEMVVEGKVKYDEPVRELLPADTVTKPAGSEITIIDLATQHSGLPRAPDNLHDVNPTHQ
jgi:serine-type D-Ala-D-Ala carboxypeptidase/endopeptidase